jgi:hypothetical protein
MNAKVTSAALLLFIAALGVPSAAALQILSPASQAIVTAGSVITVTVGPSPGETLQSVYAATTEETAQGTAGQQAGTFTVSIHVPRHAVGPTFVFVAADVTSGGQDTGHVLLVANPGQLVTLNAAAPSTLGSIGQIAAISVTGNFADGVTRKLPTLEQGTTYRSTNEAVLGVDDSGHVQARSRGTAQIVVTNTHVVSGATTTTGVTINCDIPNPPDNRIPIANPGSDVTVAPITVLHLDGSASSDPDGDPITFEWAQLSGRIVVLHDAGTASPFFVAPNVSAPEVLEFSLVVTDSKGATTLPAIVRVTVKP